MGKRDGGVDWADMDVDEPVDDMTCGPGRQRWGRTTR